ncbi:TVP38/TMEM64 family protein [Spongisporangium articulatum]|uniref:TVP38/TMEM64 family membrane protein n=1 Tax=Spongisporangium articulatum TaxID=3362603 RepID=A0ABW8AMP7_9ACTN
MNEDEPTGHDESTGPPPAPRRRGARLRLALLVLALLGALTAVLLGATPDVSAVRAWADEQGTAGLLLWALAAGLLESVMLPRPVLGAASGILYGPLLGTVANLLASLISATFAVTVGRLAGYDAVRSFVPPGQLAWLEARRDRFGLAVVVVQRAGPGLPDAWSSYGYGALGFRLRTVLTGTLIGSLPWALAYALVGANADDPLSAGGGLALAVMAGAGALGLALLLWVRRQEHEPLP